jgi:hypothetical protein
MKLFPGFTKKRTSPVERMISRKRVNKSWRKSASGTTQIKRSEAAIALLSNQLSQFMRDGLSKYELATKKLLEVKLQSAKNGLTIAELQFNKSLSKVKSIDAKNTLLLKKSS